MDGLSGDGEMQRARGENPEQRAAPRHALLIRAAKLVSSQGEFVCVVRDISSIGINLRLFHHLPLGDHLGLELQSGESFEIAKVREEGFEASFTFEKPVDVDRLINEVCSFPKRPLRLNIAIPLAVTTLSGSIEAVTENLSQQGALIDCDTRFAVDQMVRIKGQQFPEIRARVRWRNETRYGLAFDNLFALQDFAVLAARLQCPNLLNGLGG